MDHDTERLRNALQKMPVPPLRRGFVDRALATAVSRQPQMQGSAATPTLLRRFVVSWEAWTGVMVGAAAAAFVTAMLLRPGGTLDSQPLQLTLALHEMRSIDVLIDSERELQQATIRISVSGGVALDGFDSDREIGWLTHLDRGGNLLSVPVVARSAGPAKLVAIVEHDGRTRRVAIDLSVIDDKLRS